MADQSVTLTVDQMHEIVGGLFQVGKDVPLEIATSTMANAAEELRLISLVASKSEGENDRDLSNVIFAISQRLEAVSNVCLDFARKARTE